MVPVVAIVRHVRTDRGGPVARAQPELTGPFDFLFTQSTDEGRAVAPGWRPSFNTDARTRTGDPFITSEIEPFWRGLPSSGGKCSVSSENESLWTPCRQS
jgi:hypothetical protein